MDTDLHKINDQSCESHDPSHYPQGAEDCLLITRKVDIIVLIACDIVDDRRRGSRCICVISFH